MKKREALSIGEIIRRAIEQTGKSDEFDRQQACFLWSEIVGPAINRQTTRRWIDRDTLHVTIASAARKNELLFLAPALVDRINSAVGRPVITQIIIH